MGRTRYSPCSLEAWESRVVKVAGHSSTLEILC